MATVQRTFGGGAYVISVGDMVFRGHEEPDNHVGEVLEYREDRDLNDVVEVQWGYTGETTVEILDD